MEQQTSLLTDGHRSELTHDSIKKMSDDVGFQLAWFEKPTKKKGAAAKEKSPVQMNEDRRRYDIAVAVWDIY